MGGISPGQNAISTMVVSLYDTKARDLVWRGITQDLLNNNSNMNQKSLEKAVEKMFKQWPTSLATERSVQSRLAPKTGARTGGTRRLRLSLVKIVRRRGNYVFDPNA